MITTPPRPSGPSITRRADRSSCASVTQAMPAQSTHERDARRWRSALGSASWTPVEGVHVKVSRQVVDALVLERPSRREGIRTPASPSPRSNWMASSDLFPPLSSKVSWNARSAAR